MGRGLKEKLLVYGVLGGLCSLPVIGIVLRATGTVTRTPPPDSTDGAVAAVPAEQPVDLGAPLVTLYGASWCNSCQKTRAWFNERKLPFNDVDIERDAQARSAMLRLNPAGTIPTMQIGTETVIGYDPEAIETSLTRAVARRRFR